MNAKLEKIVSENKANFNSIFDQINDDRYKRFDDNIIDKLLNINDNDIRFKAIETITETFVFLHHPKLMEYILDIFKKVTNIGIARVLHFTIIDERLFNNSAPKYFYLIDTIANLSDEVKASHLSNIFINENVISMIPKEYFKSINYCLTLSNEELSTIEDNVYFNNDYKKVLLKK